MKPTSRQAAAVFAALGAMEFQPLERGKDPLLDDATFADAVSARTTPDLAAAIADIAGDPMVGVGLAGGTTIIGVQDEDGVALLAVPADEAPGAETMTSLLGFHMRIVQ